MSTWPGSDNSRAATDDNGQRVGLSAQGTLGAACHLDEHTEIHQRYYARSGLVFGGAIAVIAVAFFAFRANAILAFWLA